MSRWIDADAVKNIIRSGVSTDTEDDQEYVCGLIDEAPTIDAIPIRPQGEWIDRSDGGRILHPWWESCECSQCEEWGSGAWNFCPHCGARMRK